MNKGKFLTNFLNKILLPIRRYFLFKVAYLGHVIKTCFKIYNCFNWKVTINYFLSQNKNISNFKRFEKMVARCKTRYKL